MPEIQANGLKLHYDSFGDPANPPLLLVMGLAAQMILWPTALCERLAAAGYYVVRFDNRDIGLSEKLDRLGKPDLLRAGLRHTFGLPLKAPYTLEDMAEDTVGLMDALGLERVHLVGLSMGGMIAQWIAIKHPQRLHSLTLMMTHSGNRRLPGPTWKLRRRLIRRPKGFDRETLVRHLMGTWQLIGSPAWPPDETELRQTMEAVFDRNHHPRGVARQTMAILAAPSRVPLLSKIRTPTLVIHGTADPLVPVAGGKELARHIPGARLELIEGMGHDLPRALLPRFAELIVAHASGLSGDARAA